MEGKGVSLISAESVYRAIDKGAGTYAMARYLLQEGPMVDILADLIVANKNFRNAPLLEVQCDPDIDKLELPVAIESIEAKCVEKAKKHLTSLLAGSRLYFSKTPRKAFKVHVMRRDLSTFKFRYEAIFDAPGWYDTDKMYGNLALEQESARCDLIANEIMRYNIQVELYSINKDFFRECPAELQRTKRLIREQAIKVLALFDDFE